MLVADEFGCTLIGAWAPVGVGAGVGVGIGVGVGVGFESESESKLESSTAILAHFKCAYSETDSSQHNVYFNENPFEMFTCPSEMMQKTVINTSFILLFDFNAN